MKKQQNTYTLRRSSFRRSSITTKNSIRSEKALRIAFWESFGQNPQAKYVNGRLVEKRQNDYPCDTRVAWVDFVDQMTSSGEISESLAQRATL